MSVELIREKLLKSCLVHSETAQMTSEPRAPMVPALVGSRTVGKAAFKLS